MCKSVMVCSINILSYGHQSYL